MYTIETHNFNFKRGLKLSPFQFLYRFRKKEIRDF